ncbi:hypothetical protein RJT34_23989 [Clitoria ternatea]|uniref:Folylpoly-gamma-glutamate synthetase n=1 Tax=Clitoria ternatea TaxID=43366 RepID=A0AAN9IFG8_CLITE
MPPLFQFLTILAFKIFVSEQVDVAIIEVGLGGKEDSTNVIKEPTLCGITSLGMDHTEILDSFTKAGIFKPRFPAFTVPQPPEAMDVILEKAKELMAFEMTTSLEKDFRIDSKEILPPHEFLYDNASNGLHSIACSAVIPSLPLTIKWLRDCVKEHPSTRLQVTKRGWY